MNLLETYLFIKKMQSIVDYGCKVYVSVSVFETLEIRFEWLENNKIHRHLKFLSLTEIKNVTDIDLLADLICQGARHEYEKLIKGDK